MPDMTYTVDKDGAVIAKGAEGETRYVKESDLLTVKGVSEKLKVDHDSLTAKYNADVDNLTKARDSEHTLMLQERTAREQFESQAKEGATHKLKAVELEMELGKHRKAYGDLETEYVTTKKGILVNTYKVDQAKVKDMTLAQLRDAEKLLTTLGITPVAGQQRAKYDGGSSGAGGSGPETPYERARRIIAEQEERQGKSAAVSSAALKK